MGTRQYFSAALARDQVQQRAREVDVVERHPRHAELPRQGLGELDLADEPELDEELPELSPVLSLREERLLELRLREDARLDKELADALCHGDPSYDARDRPQREISAAGACRRRQDAAFRYASIPWPRRVAASSGRPAQRVPCGRAPSAPTPATKRTSSARRAAFPIGKVAASPDDPLIGRTLPGGYLILELVGIGGMGRVYRAEQTTLGRTVAVKIIHPHLVGDENAAARFITEARAASRLNHPNSVGIIDFGKTADGQLYLVMEFLRGRDLARVAYEEGPLPFRRIVDVLRQTLAALAEAHTETSSTATSSPRTSSSSRCARAATS